MIVNTMLLNIFSIIIGVSVFYKLKFSFLRLFSLVFLSIFFYNVYLFIVLEGKSFFLLVMLFWKGIQALLPNAIIFAIISEYSYRHFSHSKYIFLYCVAIALVLTFSFTFNFNINGNIASLLSINSIAKFIIGIIVGYVIYLIPKKMRE